MTDGLKGKSWTPSEAEVDAGADDLNGLAPRSSAANSHRILTSNRRPCPHKKSPKDDSGAPRRRSIGLEYLLFKNDGNRELKGDVSVPSAEKLNDAENIRRENYDGVTQSLTSSHEYPKHGNLDIAEDNYVDGGVISARIEDKRGEEKRGMSWLAAAMIAVCIDDPCKCYETAHKRFIKGKARVRVSSSMVKQAFLVKDSTRARLAFRVRMRCQMAVTLEVYFSRVELKMMKLTTMTTMNNCSILTCPTVHRWNLI